MSDRNANARRLQELVQIAHDSAVFYDDAAGAVANPQLQALFARMAHAKRTLIQTLGTRLVLAGQDVPESGTLAGALRKAYVDLRAAFTTHGETVYVAQLEQTEDKLLAHLESAIESLDDLKMRETVRAQLPQVRACHDEMRALKHRLAA